MVVQGPFKVVLVCHCIVQVPAPLTGMAVKVTEPPVQTVLEEGEILIVGVGFTITSAKMDVIGLQLLLAQEYTIR